MEQHKSSTNTIAFISLCLACISLLLATLPPYLTETKIEEIRGKTTVKTPSTSGINLKIKGFNIHFGKDKKEEIRVDNSAQINKLQSRLKYYKSGMLISSILAIFTALYAWKTGRDRQLSIGSLVTAVAALAWQYVVAGVTIGISIFVLLMLLANFG